MKITIEVREVFGKQTIYPICDTSKKLAKLAGTKTLTKEALKIIESLGYEITLSQKDLDFLEKYKHGTH